MLFSIVTVTRNNKEGLLKTWHTLEPQACKSFEWIVIDGNSDDGTKDWLEQSAAQWISEPDNGIYDAMNKGIARAKGFFTLFLNAGDSFACEHTLEDIAAYIQELQETPDFIYGDALEERPGAKPAYKPARPYEKKAYGMFTHHQAMLYRTDLIDDLRYDQNYKIAADYKFTLQFLERAQTIVYCPFPLCLFESGGISQQQATQGRSEQCRIRDELGTVSRPHNHFIVLRQKTVWTIRKILPRFYWFIKQRNKPI